MAYNDLRSFLKVLEDNGQLLRITEPVWPEPDIGAAASAANKGLGETAPALMFENIRGFQKPKLATNVHGSWPNMALMFGLPKDTQPKKQFLEFSRRYQNFSKGTLEERQTAPWQEVLIEDNINLYELMPHFRLNAGDGGLYLSKSAVISRHPDRHNEQNVGMYRFQVKGPNRLSGQFVPEHDIAVHFKAAEQQNKPLPIAITLGNDPIISIVAAMPLLYGQDEYQMASALTEEPCPVVTLKNGLQVPWGSEYVLEAHVLPGVREPDGPYGEFTGHLSGLRNMTSVVIDRVWHRKEPIYEYTSIGMPWTEIDYIFLNTCPPLYVQLKEKFPEIEAVNALYTHGLIVIVSTKVRVGGFGKAVGMAVMTTPHGMGYAKVVIVVDDFVDPFNLPQVMWAISTKVNPKYDTIILPELSVLPLDPGSEPPGITHKLIIDATTPAPPEKHGEYSMQVMDPPEAKDWLAKLQALWKRK